MSEHVAASLDPTQRRHALRAVGATDRGVLSEPDASRYMCPVAVETFDASVARWGECGAVRIVGRSPQLVSLLGQIKAFARYEQPILVIGESGSGKESIAQAIHLMGPRRQKPFVAVNCPQYGGENLSASEFFGHIRGSFTGAIADRKGAFDQADSGVVFLDEVGDLPMGTQAILLRALEKGDFRPVGSQKSHSVDVRIVAATNRDLQQMRGGGQFREDLYFRLAHFTITVPPLRDRDDDWALLAEYFLRRLSSKYGIVKSFSAESMRVLGSHSWPGNIRELNGVVAVGYAMCDSLLIEPHHFIDKIETRGPTPSSLEEDAWQTMVSGGGTFWEAVRDLYIDRELNRRQVRALVRRGLVNAQGKYNRLLELFGLPQDDYQRFMDFLRHHDLKPSCEQRP